MLQNTSTRASKLPKETKLPSRYGKIRLKMRFQQLLAYNIVLFSQNTNTLTYYQLSNTDAERINILRNLLDAVQNRTRSYLKQGKQN